MRYLTNCVGSGDGQAIQDMTDRAKQITRRTFLLAVERADLAELERALCYDTGTERGGLRMANDWHIGYYRSVYQGQPCVYFAHSCIEYIFV